ncbi:protein phosphatase methylesterase 1 [Pseudomyrmex gracilis]|uniref:protein phosphatase methylesterase 1 n=1 Tax=Pseudomyrmex gracilis TaxID=219809 RepID=UPI000995CC86|nr:protein phosphatase methylesterase 1 [Pseudomyrmex gracilis]XP_020279680.1 protein phosphatase methylesterase 1 [Pseudomyrmex gracilis]XP_020279681.1 protein phosphatase methylesterase 1 [Pseudomyrmex gracilis]
MSALQKSILKSRLPPSTVNFPALNSRLNKSRGFQRKRDYDPVQWNLYFDYTKDVVVGKNTFHVYIKGTEGPLLVLLHGGGYSGLTWAELTKSIMTMILCRVMAIDLRGHGDTHTTDDDDLSADTLASDVEAIIGATVELNTPIILFGHSMGGAVAVKAAPLIPNLCGLGVIDVVEGTAMDALASMQSFLRSRPSGFSTISQAIEWCVRSGQIRNIQSAKVSVPGQIKNIETSKLATHDIDSQYNNTCESNPAPVIPRDDVIQEEESLTMPPPPPASSAASTNRKYVWRIDLAKTEQHWFGWFKGLSTAFLNVSVPKMLLLAGVDRLDRELTVGQMQGKFQMQVLPACGHAVHEDVPDKVAEAIATFMVRHKFAEPASDFPRTFPAC